MDTAHLQHFARIGIALSAEKNIGKLLEMIVDEARNLTRADGGTLYILDEEKKCLRFEILQNDTLKVRMGGTSGIKITLPPVPLEIEGKPNQANVSSYVALTGRIVNISDLDEAEGFDFSGVKKYDTATRYRSKSMLLIPMKNHEGDIIGVLQLLNAKDAQTAEVISFDPKGVDAVALTNRRLIEDLTNLFDAFIRSIAGAIDQKSPYTGGHIRRVTELTMMIAEKINASADGPFAGVRFSEEQLEELRIAAWMHDIGKIVLPEWVVSKKTKLQTLMDGVDLIEVRFQLIRQLIENKYYNRHLELERNGQADPQTLQELRKQWAEEVANLEKDREFIEACNKPEESMKEENVQRLKQIACQRYELQDRTFSFLTDEEVYKLSVRKGTLTAQERKVIQSHASMSIQMLRELPFPKKFSRIPDYAGAHHERLDGSGYPLGLKAEQLPLQARIIAVADVFESLTAQDRPYRDSIGFEEAVEILRQMKDNRHIDPDLFDLLVETGLYKEYGRKILGIT